MASPNFGDGEDVKRAIKRLLDGPAFLTAMTTVVGDKADGIWPLMPQIVVFEEERLSNNAFPSAELILYRSEYQQESEIAKYAKHTIAIRWTTVSYDESTVTKQLERLVRASTEVLWNSTLDTQVASGPITVTEEDYSPLVPGTANYPFLKSALVIMEVQTWRS